MPDSSIATITKAVTDLGPPAGFAQQYGPYYFALLLLALCPFICRAVFWNSLKATNVADRAKAYDDFRFYFRAIVVLGCFCVIVGVGLFLYKGFRNDEQREAEFNRLNDRVQSMTATLKNMKFAASGIIASGLKPQDLLSISYVPATNMSIVFSRLPVGSQWYFVIMSDTELPASLDLNIAWTQIADDGKPMTATPLPVPVQLLLGKSFANYSFTFAGSIVKIQPITQ